MSVTGRISSGLISNFVRVGFVGVYDFVVVVETAYVVAAIDLSFEIVDRFFVDVFGVVVVDNVVVDVDVEILVVATFWCQG